MKLPDWILKIGIYLFVALFGTKGLEYLQEK